MPKLRIDIDGVLKSRLPRHYRFIPRALVRWVEHLVRQDKMNRMLEATDGLRGAEFCRGILEYLGDTYEVHGAENIPTGDDARVTFVCNHPLGGLDGMVLIDMLTRATGRKVKFPVNDLLMAVEPLTDVFLPLNKHGRQSRAASEALDAAFASSAPIVIFPAGLCSRRDHGHTVADRQWQKTFINKSIAHHRNIIPLHFSGENSSFFYNFAKLREKIGLKLNIEMVRLPAEVVDVHGKHFTVTVGKPINIKQLQGGPKAQLEAEAIKKIVYQLPINEKK